MASGGGLAPHLRRYWNPALLPLYDRVAKTPLHPLGSSTTKTLSDRRCVTTMLRPAASIANPLKADAFASLLVPNTTELLPPRPCFAQFPSNKRKAGACSQRKEALPTGSFFRSIKIRMKPTKAQATVFRRWFASARYHFNTAADILNTTFDRCHAETYLDALSRGDSSLTDDEQDPFFWYQFMRAEQISGVSATIPFKSGEADEYGDRDVLGLREAVKDILKAVPDPEKLASPPKDLRWTQQIPCHIADEAVNDASKALKTNLAKFADGKEHRFRGISFRSLRNLTRTPTEVLRLEATRSKPGARVSGPISKITATPEATIPGESPRRPRTGTRPKSRKDFYTHIAVTGCMKGLGPVRCVDHKPVVDRLTSVGYTEHESEILWDKRTDNFYFVVKHAVKRVDAPDRTLADGDAIGFDPGVRCFDAYSCPDGRHGSLLEGGLEVMQNYARKAARLQSTADKLKSGDFRPRATRGSIARDLRAAAIGISTEECLERQQRSIAARARRARVKAHNWMKCMHYEAIRETFAMADLVIIPVFETERMCARAERIFGTGTARDMYAWSHYSFMQRLYYKAQITPNKHVAFTREPGTTKTCDACGCVRENLGGAKIFMCYGCGHRAGRDVGHASRGNILAAIGAANNTPWDGVERVAARGSVSQNN